MDNVQEIIRAEVGRRMREIEDILIAAICAIGEDERGNAVIDNQEAAQEFLSLVSQFA